MFVIEVEDMSCLEVLPPEPALPLSGLGTPQLVNVRILSESALALSIQDGSPIGLIQNECT